MASIEHLKILLTGANGGLGRAFLDALADRGVAKIYAAVRQPDRHRDLITRFGDRIVLLPLDLGNAASIDAVAAAAAGDVDLIISNAGQTLMGPILENDEIALRTMFEVNMFGPHRLVRAMLPTLQQRQGGIIYILSMAAWLPALGAEAYSASKAGLMMLGHGVRSATKDSNLRVSFVYPGFIDTPMSSAFDVKKTNPRQIAERALEGWQTGRTSIFPDLFAEMTETALLEQMPRILNEPQDVLNQMVDEFVAHPRAGQ